MKGNKIERINSISELLERKEKIILYEGEDNNLHRMAVRHLTGLKIFSFFCPFKIKLKTNVSRNDFKIGLKK